MSANKIFFILARVYVCVSLSLFLMEEFPCQEFHSI
jgi:hypothetical protein